MRRKLDLALAALATAGLVLVFVALAASDEAAAWRELPAPPLSPRETPTWTGEEVVLVGGSDAPPCPPTAACSVPRVAPLADGAAYDPAIEAWRAIADAPVGFSWAEPELIDGSAYLWIAGENGRPNAPSAFLAYRIEEDRWEQLDLPTRDLGWHEVLAAGDRIVAHTYDDSDGERPDYVFETRTSTWRSFPTTRSTTRSTTRTVVSLPGTEAACSCSTTERGTRAARRPARGSLRLRAGRVAAPR